jgi:hypothetical protein
VASFWRLLLPLACLACDFSSDGLSRVQAGGSAPGGPGSTDGGRGNLPPIYPPNFPPPIDDPIPGVLPPDAGADAVPAPDAGAASDASRAADGGLEAPSPTLMPPPAVQPPPTPPPPVIDCPDDNRLRLCLRFERNLRNESPNDLMVQGNQVDYEAGLPGAGSAVRVGGGTQIRVSMTGGAVNLATFTVEAWVRLDRLPAANDRATVIDRQGGYTMTVQPDGAVTCARGSSRVVSPAGAVAAGAWVSLACTADNREVAVWINGAVSAGASVGGNQGDSVGGISLGRNQSNDDAMFGLLDNVRLWDHIRQPDQICNAAISCR